MALLSEDRAKLANLIHKLTKRIQDKQHKKKLESVGNKLSHHNPLSPSDLELLQRMVVGLLDTPMPVLSSGATVRDYALVVPAVRKHLATRRLIKRAAKLRQEYREILKRL